jgi:hypothetical protein
LGVSESAIQGNNEADVKRLSGSQRLGQEHKAVPEGLGQEMCIHRTSTAVFKLTSATSTLAINPSVSE